MDAKKILEARKQAEKAVAEMSDGELKVKAFEVILNHLLGGFQTLPREQVEQEHRAPPTRQGKAPKEAGPAKSATSRILVLRDEGFFNTQRTIAEVREELKAHGWHYPLTALSGRLQGLVQKRNLRRERATQGKKKVWKYSNP